MVDQKQHDPDKVHRVLQELDFLEKILSEQKYHDRHQGDGKTMALVKFIKGLTEEQWNLITAGSNVDPSWMPLCLNGQKISTVLKLLDTIEILSNARDRDPLTGLYNRGFFQRMLEREMEKSYAYKIPLTLAFLDIDDFKAINDIHGHVCGDEVLKNLADILTSRIRSGDYAVRFGGEEFVLVLPGTGRVHSLPLLERIIEEIRNVFISCSAKAAKIKYSVSIGSVTYRGRAKLRPEDLVAQADKELYKVKNAGKNSISSVAAIELVDDTSMVRRDEKDFLLKG